MSMLGGRCFANLFRQLFVEKLIVLLAIEAVGGIDQQVLVMSPEYTKPRWVGIGGTIRRIPAWQSAVHTNNSVLVLRQGVTRFDVPASRE